MMNKRDLILNMLDPNTKLSTFPAAFFLHFDPAYHLGQASIDKHLEYFHYTEMDFVKIQLELPFLLQPQIQKPEDWKTRLRIVLFFPPPRGTTYVSLFRQLMSTSVDF